MSILIVNLKHLYKRRGLWLVYPSLGLLVFASLAMAFDRPSAGKGNFMGLVMLQFMIGLCTASLPVEILTKPFSYCLPGHRAVPRKFVIWVGVVTSIPGSVVFLACPRLHWWESAPLICCSAFFAGLILYWIGAGLAFGVRNSNLIAGWASLLLLGVAWSDLHVIAERMIISHPFAIIFLGMSSGVVTWIWLGNSNWARRLCATARIHLFDALDRNKLLEYKRRRAAVKWDKFKNHPDPWVERFFLGHMNNCNHLGPGRYIWGGLYTTYGVALSRRKEILSWLLVVLAMLVCLSYTRPGGTNILFFMAGAMVTHMRLPIHSSMTTSGGRNERFATAIILAGTTAVLVTAALAVVASTSMALAPIMPDITLRGANLTFHATSLRLLIVPSAIIPVALALRLILFRKPFSALAAILVVIAMMFAFGIGSSEGFGRLINPTSLISLLILSWLALAVVLRHICMRRSLVGQKGTY